MTPTLSRPRRALAIGSLVLTAALVLTGCGRSADSTSSTSADVDDSPATGTLSIWIGGAEGEALPDFLTDFEAANPDLDVEVTQIPSTEFDSKLLTALASGTAPDLVRLYSQTQASVLATGSFAPVPDDLVDPDSFFPTVQELGVVDGVNYTVPWDAYATVLQYRKDVAAAAGISAPTTWDEMKTFAAAMKAQGETWGVGLDVGYDGYSAQGLNEFVHQNGGSFISDDLSTWTIDTPENVEALEYWGSFFTEGLASPDGPTFLDTVPWFSSNQIASKNIGPWFKQWLVDANDADWVEQNLATAVVPAGSAGSISSLGSGSLAVPVDANNPDAAWKLARYLAEPASQVAWYTTFGSLPAVEAAWDDPAIADDDLQTPVSEALQTAVGVPSVSTWSQVGDAIGKQMERVARGQASAQDALTEAQRFAESVGTGS